jgi:hypothetical protein
MGAIRGANDLERVSRDTVNKSDLGSNRSKEFRPYTSRISDAPKSFFVSFVIFVAQISN